MQLQRGVCVGPYEILSALGAGGMGEVYRARDTKLKREVAIKVLPDAFSRDPDRLARFQREAELLATLNHPNIAAVYGLEQASGVTAIVLELVDGETLADRIRRGPLPLKDTLPIARQIADAMEAAHDRGIVHRDLKPANVAIAKDGLVKVLDFGLAKAAAGDPSTPDLTHSPTMTMGGTRGGVLLGTAAYMSPEQARGLAVDTRTDIWAFGCVLYEMLTGRAPFARDTTTDTLAAIVDRDPSWSALPATTPPAVQRLLRRCLDKDPRRRLHAIADARIEIEDVFSGASFTSAETAGVAPRRQSARLAWSIAAVASLVAIAGLAWNVRTAPKPGAAPPRVNRFGIAPSGTAALSLDGNDRDLAITPDATRIVYVGNAGTQLFVRSLEQLDPMAIATGAGLRAVFIAPDGQWVGFVDTTATLKKVAITGGPAVTIAQMDGASRGATWAQNDTVIFGTGAVTTGLQRVSAAGGAVTVLTRPARERGESDHVWPESLPGGRAVLFTITAATGGFDASQVAALDLETGKSTVLVRGGYHAHYVAGGPGSPTRDGGHLVYATGGTLKAIGFDLARLETRGTPVTVLPRVVTTQQGAADFDVAADGTLAYADAPAVSPTAPRTMVWVNRQGREDSIAAPPRAYFQPRVSPDGTRVAVSLTDQEKDIWVWDLARHTLTRLTNDPAFDVWPVWTRDSRRLLFASSRAGANNIYTQPTDGTGAAERLTQTANQQHPTDVSPDGRQVIFHEVTPTRRRDLMLLSLDGTHESRPLLQTPFEERNGLVSPDGRWLLYESDSSGRFEIYVRPFPNASAGPQSPVSTAGGTRAVWARSGRELFFVAQDGALMAARVETRGGTWIAGAPTKVLDGRYFTAIGDFGRNYDVAPDGRFLMIKKVGGDSTTAPQIVVVQNWTEELKRLVPTTR